MSDAPTPGFDDVDGSPWAPEMVQAMDQTARWPAVQRLQLHSAAQLAVRPGDRVLDVGCGLGAVALALAEQAGPSGTVVGLDASQIMIEEARRRASERDVEVELRVGDAEQLDLPDASFDVCRSERTLQWLEHPDRAVREMIRVLRPGGRLGVIDTDWATFTLDHPDAATTARITNATTSAPIPNPRSGRRLLGQFRAGGLEAIDVAPDTALFTEWDPDIGVVGGFIPFPVIVDNACRAGAVTEDEASAWLAQLEGMARTGHFFASVTMFSVTGHKPA